MYLQIILHNGFSAEKQMQLTLTGHRLPIPVQNLNSSEHKTTRLANKQHTTNICNTL